MRIKIDWNTLNETQRNAMKRIREIRNEMGYSSIVELEKLFEEAEDLWWEHLTYYAEQYAQADRDAPFEKDYHDWKRFRMTQLPVVVINGNVTITNSHITINGKEVY